MAARELIALGTSSQVPTRHRNHNAYFLRWDDTGFLFDPGEGTQRQFAFAGLAVSVVHHLCITHFHGDHCLGLAGLIQRLSLDNCAHPVHLHFPRSGQTFVDRMRHASIYYPSPSLELKMCPIAETDGLQVLFENDDFRLLAHPLEHGVPTMGFRLEERDRRKVLPEKADALGVRGPLVGQLLREGKVTVDGKVITTEDVSVLRPGQVFALVMDTKICAGAVALARGADLLVMEATYTGADQALATAHGHSSAVDAATVARDAGARKLAITHFSQRYDSVEQHLIDARAIFPNTVALQDLDKLAIDRADKAPHPVVGAPLAPATDPS